MRSTSNATTCQAMGLSISLVLLMMLATLAQSRPYHSVKIATFRSHTNPFGTEPSLVSRISIAESLRGGATVEEEDDDVDQYDDYDEEDEEGEEETEDETEDETEEEEEYDDEEAAVAEASEGEYDEPYVMSPSMQLYITFGAMMLSRRVDLFTPLIVGFIRFAFIAQLVIQQLFILYVRVMAKKKNDMTPVTVQNPLSGMLQSQLEQQEGANGMVKSLASSFLSSASTVKEYDMKQALSMQGGIVFTMAFMWLLHFKMEKVQPLLMQVATGFTQLAYHPLFQVYVLGRNLERPFKGPANAAQKIMEAKKASDKAAEENSEEDTQEEEVEENSEDTVDEAEDEEEAESDAEEETEKAEEDGEDEDSGEDEEVEESDE